MIECARCGYQNDAAAKFCAACGAPMAASPAAWGPAAQQAAPPWGPPVPQAAPQPWGPPPNMQAPSLAQVPNNPPSPQWGAPVQSPYGVPPPQWGALTPQAPPLPQAPLAAPGQPPASPGWGYPGAMATPPDASSLRSSAAEPTAQPPANPSWGYPGAMVTPAEASPLRSPAAEPTAPPVVPTTASAVVAPLEPDQIPPNAPRTLAAFFVNFDANPLGQYWAVHQGQNLVGRKGSGVELHLEIDHPTTSSRHATIHAAARPGRLKVEDLGSTNGTYVNERRLEPGERRTLQTGDSLRFGGFSVTVITV